MYCEWNNIKHLKYFFTISFSFSPCYCCTDFLLDICFWCRISEENHSVLHDGMEINKINTFHFFFFLMSNDCPHGKGFCGADIQCVLPIEVTVTT